MSAEVCNYLSRLIRDYAPFVKRDETEDIRVRTVRNAHSEGLRSPGLPPDSPPWLRVGLRNRHRGKRLTVTLLQEADRQQNMTIPEDESKS